MNDILGRRARLKRNHFGNGRCDGKVVFCGHGEDPFVVVQRDDGSKFECVRHEVVVSRGPIPDADQCQIIEFAIKK